MGKPAPNRPSGNTSSSKHGYSSVKWGGNSPVVKAITGSALISGGVDDMEYGLPFDGSIQEGPHDTGVYEWKTADIGKPRMPNRSRPQRSSAGP